VRQKKEIKINKKVKKSITIYFGSVCEFYVEHIAYSTEEQALEKGWLGPILILPFLLDDLVKKEFDCWGGGERKLK